MVRHSVCDNLESLCKRMCSMHQSVGAQQGGWWRPAGMRLQRGEGQHWCSAGSTVCRAPEPCLHCCVPKHARCSAAVRRRLRHLQVEWNGIEWNGV